jgi:hypothetical protein
MMMMQQEKKIVALSQDYDPILKESALLTTFAGKFFWFFVVEDIYKHSYRLFFRR